MILINNTKLLSLETNSVTNPIVTLMLPKNFQMMTSVGELFRMCDYRLQAKIADDENQYLYSFETEDENNSSSDNVHQYSNLIVMLRKISELHLKGNVVSNVFAKLLVKDSEASVNAENQKNKCFFTRNAYEHLAEIAFMRGVTVVDYDPSWANGTGYQNGFNQEQFPVGLDEVVFIDNYGRFNYGINTPFGSVVMFQRYTTETLIVQNQSRTFSSLQLTTEKVPTKENVEMLVGLHDFDVSIGKRFKRLLEKQIENN